MLGIDVECAEGVEEAVGGQQSAVSCSPNPTRGIFEFRFTVYDFGSVILRIFNAQGQEVAVVLDEVLPDGEHTVRWEAPELPAGIYFYRLTAGNQSSTGKMVVVK